MYWLLLLLLLTGRRCKRGRRWTTATVPQVECDTSLVVSGGVDCGRRRRNVSDKKPQRYAKDNRTAHLTARSDKSAAYVTNNKRLYSTFCTVEANYRQTGNIARPLCATVELLVLFITLLCVCRPQYSEYTDLLSDNLTMWRLTQNCGRWVTGRHGYASTSHATVITSQSVSGACVRRALMTSVNWGSHRYERLGDTVRQRTLTVQVPLHVRLWPVSDCHWFSLSFFPPSLSLSLSLPLSVRVSVCLKT